jgi:hypothetical protein
MKKYIVKVLKWALSKFDRSPEEIAAWPFPVPTKDFNPRPAVKKPTLKKATTRKVAAKMPTKKKPVTKKAK